MVRACRRNVFSEKSEFTSLARFSPFASRLGAFSRSGPSGRTTWAGRLSRIDARALTPVPSPDSCLAGEGRLLSVGGHRGEAGQLRSPKFF